MLSTYAQLIQQSAADLRFGYSILPIDLLALTVPAYESIRHYMESDDRIKQRHMHQDSVEYGYKRLLQKESFAIRNGDVPDELKNTLPLCKAFHHLTRDILKQIANDLQLNPEKLLSLIGEEALPDSGLAQSVFRLNNYHPMQVTNESEGSGAHQDLGLLTFLPRSNIPALEIFDSRHVNSWINIEDQMSETDIVVMAGESLGLLSNYRYQPALHRVKAQKTTRTSIVYHSRINHSVLLSSKSYETKITGPFDKPFEMTAGEMMQHEYSLRKSVNGSY